MWRNKKARGRCQYRETPHGQGRDSNRGQDSFRGRSKDRYDRYEDERHLSDRDRNQTDNLERGNARYLNDQDRLAYDSRYDVEDVRYNSDRGRHESDYYDSREIKKDRGDEFCTVSYTDHERDLYSYEDTRHMEKDRGADKGQFREDWDGYRGDIPQLTDDRIDYEGNFDDYRVEERSDHRHRQVVPDDRDFKRDYYQQGNKEENRLDRRREFRDRDPEGGRTSRNDKRPRYEDGKSQGRQYYGGSKSANESQNRFSTRGIKPSRGKFKSTKDVSMRLGKQQEQRIWNKQKHRKVITNDERNMSVGKSRSDSSKNRYADQRQPEDPRRDKKAETQHSGNTYQSSSRDREKGSDAPYKRSDSSSGTFKTEVKVTLNQSSRSDRIEDTKRDINIKGRKNSKEKDSSNRHHSGGNNADVKVESRKLYGSFHDDDAISIIVDDDRFASETRKYMEKDSFSTVNVKSETGTRKHVEESRSDETFQIHADSSATIFEEQAATPRKTGNEFKTPSASRYSSTDRSRSNKITDSKRADDRQLYRKRTTPSLYKNIDHNRQPYWKRRTAGSSYDLKLKSRFGKQFEKAGQNMRQHTLSSRHDYSRKTGDEVTVRIGRTGAVLSEDINVEEDGNMGRDETVHSSRGPGNSRNKYSYTRAKRHGFTSSDKVKQKYFGKSFVSQRSNVKQNRYEKNKSPDKKERFSKLRNERNRKDFEKASPVDDKRVKEDLNLNESDLGQNLIFIPNHEFHDGQVPMFDQFGNALGNSDLPLAPVQQMPVQFISSNIPLEGPQGAEYVFIPFDHLGGVGDMPFNQNLLTDTALGSRDILGQQNDIGGLKNVQGPNETSKEDKINQYSSAFATSKMLLKKKRKQRLLLIRRERRKALERKLERRVFLRLMQSTKQSIKAEQDSAGIENKKKPVIKRISPPPATATSSKNRSNSQDQRSQDCESEDYDNISDLEDITDDENGEIGNTFRDQSRAREQRRAKFRKPGEPRVGVIGKGRVHTTDSTGPLDSWQARDVRKVVEKGSPHNTSRSPNVERAESQHAFDTKGSIKPLQITVSNDQYEEDSNPYNTSNRQRGHENDGDRTIGSGYGRFNKPYNLAQSQESERLESSRRNREFIGEYNMDEEEGKYGGIATAKRYQQNYGFSNADHGHQNRPFTPNRGRKNFNGSPFQSKMSTGIKISSQSSSNDQFQGNFKMPFSQQPVPRLQNQNNSGHSLAHQQLGLNQSGLQFTLSDPSLPPVSQGVGNFSQFPMSGQQADMSMPPTMAVPNSSMSGGFLPERNFPQQNVQVNNSLLQRQSNITDVQQPQQQPVNQTIMGGSQVQSQVVMAQQAPRTSSQIISSNAYQRHKVQSGPIQQQQTILGVAGTYQPKHFDSNQRTSQGVLGQLSVSTNKAFISGHSVVNESYMSASPNDASQVIKSNISPMVSGQGLVNQNFIPRASTPQVFGSVKAAHGIPNVSKASLQMSRTVVAQSQSDFERGRQQSQPAAGNYNRGAQYRIGQEISRPTKMTSQDTFGSSDIDDEFGELLCVKCDKVFLSESVMRRHSKWHILVDAGVRELRCDTCEQGFTSSVAFDAHMAEKHLGGQWRCERCALDFTNRGALVRHNQAGRHKQQR